MTSRLVAALLLAVPVAAAAHPHATVEQQALLSLGRTQAVLTYLIVPSTKDGAHMFAHLDADGDATLSRAEQIAFATELLAGTILSVDGAALELSLGDVAFPDRAAMSAGNGVIRVTACTKLALDSAGKHDVALEVTHDRFAEEWFLQPYYFPDLVEGGTLPGLKRRSGSAAIDIFISEN
jgi:hypothetical protein